MTITVSGPNGVTVDFPDGTSGDVIHRAMTAQFAGAQAPPDKYQQAAQADIATLKAKGGDEGAGYTRRLAHGATLGADSTILAGLETPLEMIKRGTWSPSEGYNYAKAREDQIMNDARENTGMLGNAAELVGGAATGGGLSSGTTGLTREAGQLVARMGPQVTAARLLAPDAGLLARSGAMAADSAALGGVAGGMEGNGLKERAENAIKGAGAGALFGGALPLGGAVLRGVAAPIFANARARINPEGYGQAQIARAVHESGLPASEIEQRVQQAAAEGQPQFTVADALGNPGQEMLGTAARGAGPARTQIVEALENRQAGQGRRVANAISEGFNAPQTAAQTERAMTAARDTTANADYGAVRSGAGQVDVVPTINHIDQTIGTGSGQNLQLPNDTIEGALRPFRERLARVNPDDFEAVQRIRSDMADAAQNARQNGYGNRGRLIGNAVRELDAAMEAASPGYRDANANFAQRSRNIEQIGEGRTSALRGRTEDTVPAFQAQTPEGQQAFRVGYADPLIEAAQGSAQGVNKARPLANDAFRTEAQAMAPGNDLMQRRLGREMTMFETRGTATGGSPTAKNLAHDAAMSVDPHLVGNILSGNWHGAIRNVISAGHNALTGNTPAVRQAVANVLLQNGVNLPPGQLGQIVDRTIQRMRFVQNLARAGQAARQGLTVATAQEAADRR